MLKYVLLLFFIPLLSFASDRYSNVVKELNSLQSRFPQAAFVESIGKNNDNQDILSLHIKGSNPQFAMLVVGTHHGNEGETADIALNFAEKTLQGGFDPEVEYYVIPVLNIPGYNSYRRWENGFDPNRDYPSPCKQGRSDFNLKSTKALADLMRTKSFSASVTLHGFIGVVVYPWGISTRDTQTLDNAYFASITDRVAGVNGYRPGNSTELIYPADGCFEDWAYWELGVWSLLFEIENRENSDLDKNVDAISTFFNSVNRSPSVDHRFMGQCDNSFVDLYLE